MAFITIRNGRVTFPNAKGFTLLESFTTRDGDLIEKKYKVWTDEQVRDGEFVTVSGVFSAKVAEYNGHTYVEVSVNKPKLDRGFGGGSQLEQKKAYDSIEDAPF